MVEEVHARGIEDVAQGSVVDRDVSMVQVSDDQRDRVRDEEIDRREAQERHGDGLERAVREDLRWMVREVREDVHLRGRMVQSMQAPQPRRGVQHTVDSVVREIPDDEVERDLGGAGEAQRRDAADAVRIERRREPSIEGVEDDGEAQPAESEVIEEKVGESPRSPWLDTAAAERTHAFEQEGEGRGDRDQREIAVARRRGRTADEPSVIALYVRTPCLPDRGQPPANFGLHGRP